jgi:hypothetical protein
MGAIVFKKNKLNTSYKELNSLPTDLETFRTYPLWNKSSD